MDQLSPSRRQTWSPPSLKKHRETPKTQDTDASNQDDEKKHRLSKANLKGTFILSGIILMFSDAIYYVICLLRQAVVLFCSKLTVIAP